ERSTSLSVVSHGSRSWSVRGTPARILAMLAGGWWSSASTNDHPSSAASAAPTCVLPLPDTPVTTTLTGAAPSSPTQDPLLGGAATGCDPPSLAAAPRARQWQRCDAAQRSTGRPAPHPGGADHHPLRRPPGLIQTGSVEPLDRGSDEERVGA